MLARVPLRSLTCEQLSRYGFKAMTTWGDAEDYKHFLPRIVELACTREGRAWPGMSPELIADKLRMAEIATWPDVERAALSRVAVAAWGALLEHDPEESGWSARVAVPELAALIEDVTPYLERWSSHPTLTALLQLADFMEGYWGDLATHGRLLGRWPDDANRERVERWLVDPARARALEAAFEANLDGPHGATLAKAIDQWQWMAAGAR